MLLACLGIDNVDGLVSTGQTFPDEGKQNAILFVVIGEKCADVAHLTELRGGERNWLRRWLHVQVLPLEIASRRGKNYLRRCECRAQMPDLSAISRLIAKNKAE